jgi:hypothetical protein
MANPKNKFRVDINAQENKLTGVLPNKLAQHLAKGISQPITELQFTTRTKLQKTKHPTVKTWKTKHPTVKTWKTKHPTVKTWKTKHPTVKTWKTKHPTVKTWKTKHPTVKTWKTKHSAHLPPNPCQSCGLHQGLGFRV